MGLLINGFWNSRFWPLNYWNDRYWLKGIWSPTRYRLSIIGETTKIKLVVRNVDGNLEDPTSMTISIWLPDGTLDIDAVAMDNDSTGKYHYWYVVKNQVGICKILYEATTDGKLSKQRDELDVISEL